MVKQLTLGSATEKLPTWKPQHIPMEEPEREAYRVLARETVFYIWRNKTRPTDLNEIYKIVMERIAILRREGKWPYKAKRGKRTIDRRVNEAASPDFYPDKIPRICAVTAGIYQPNPAVFDVSVSPLFKSQK